MSQTITIPATFKYGYIVPKKFISSKYINKDSIITINITNNDELPKNDKYLDNKKNPITWTWTAQDFLQKLKK